MVALVLALEQTVGATTGNANGATWLQWAAAFGTLISLTTLAFTVFFRIRDSQTRATIRGEVRQDPGTRPEVYFQVVGRSKIPLHLNQQGFLGTTYESGPICSKRAVTGSGSVVQQGSFRNYVEDLAYLQMMLHQGGYQDQDMASVYFAVEDANGKVHEQPVLFTGLKHSDTTVTALPFPWYKRWARRFHRWWQIR